jgi:hypothetical protein
LDGMVKIITGKERRRRWSIEEKLRIVSEVGRFASSRGQSHEPGTRDTPTD